MALDLNRRVFTSFLLLCGIASVHGASLGDGHNPPPPPPPPPRSLVLVKLYCLIIIFFVTFAGGISPCFIKWNDGLLVLGTQLGGGVFLGAALTHFLNDANHTFQKKLDHTYPFAFMLACVGYLLTMLADCIVQWVFSKVSKTSPPKHDAAATPKGPRRVTEATDHTCKRDDDDVSKILEDEHSATTTLLSNTSGTDTILLIFALCFHSIFEGMAVGVAQKANDAWRTLWTISLHKLLAAIAMGIALIRMLPPRPIRQCTIYSFLFAISIPIGVAIGLTVNSTTKGAIADWMHAISMSIACGVFIYVAINHLLVKGYVPRCRVKVDTPFFRFLAASLGVGISAISMIWH